MPGAVAFVDIGILGQRQEAASSMNTVVMDDYPAVMGGEEGRKRLTSSSVVSLASILCPDPT